ncbi:MAG: ABC transporter substrate-binding protein [Chloroflexi bacterium]|nr:ABC transporter substrate-binding protein [Chloroflexota bacterium]
MSKPEEPKKAPASVSGITLDPNAKFGGVVRAAYTSEGPSFSTWEESAGIPFVVNAPMTNGLVRLRNWGTDEDLKNQAYFEIHPDLARSWEQSTDGLTWVFSLRDGVKWTDGTPFTCADVKWSLDTIRTGEGLRRSPRAKLFAAVREVTCRDALTMVINMKEPKPGLLDVLSLGHNEILPRNVYDGKFDALRDKPHTAGTGPFLLKGWVPGEKYTLVRNPDYWDKPFPYLDGVEFSLLATSAQYTAVRAGRLDIPGSNASVSGAAGDTLIKECTTCRVWSKVVNQGPWPALLINHQRVPWNNPLIKDAISLAISRKKFQDLLLPGYTVMPTGGPFYPGSFWAMPKERLAQIPGYDFDHPEENKQRARELLAKAGYGPGQLTVPLSIGAFSKDDMPIFIEELESVGFKVEATQYEAARMYEVMGAGDFNLFTGAFYDGGTLPENALTEHFYTGSDRNYNRYSNIKVDQLIDEVSRTVDQEKRRSKAWDAAEIALREQGAIYVGMRASAFVHSGRVRGFMPVPGHVWTFNRMFDHVWVTESN